MCPASFGEEEEEGEGHMVYCMQCGNGVEHQQLGCNLQKDIILNTGHMMP